MADLTDERLNELEWSLVGLTRDETKELLSAYRDRHRWEPIVRAAIAWEALPDVAASSTDMQVALESIRRVIEAVRALEPEHRPEPSE